MATAPKMLTSYITASAMRWLGRHIAMLSCATEALPDPKVGAWIKVKAMRSLRDMLVPILDTAVEDAERYACAIAPPEVDVALVPKQDADAFIAGKWDTEIIEALRSAPDNFFLMLHDVLAARDVDKRSNETTSSTVETS